MPRCYLSIAQQMLSSVQTHFQRANAYCATDSFALQYLKDIVNRTAYCATEPHSSGAYSEQLPQQQEVSAQGAKKRARREQPARTQHAGTPPLQLKNKAHADKKRASAIGVLEKSLADSQAQVQSAHAESKAADEKHASAIGVLEKSLATKKEQAVRDAVQAHQAFIIQLEDKCKRLTNTEQQATKELSQAKNAILIANGCFKRGSAQLGSALGNH